MLSCSVVSTLCNPMGCSLPGSSVHWISQSRILEWVAISFSRGSSWPRDKTHISCVSCIGRQIIYHQCHPRSLQLFMIVSYDPWYFCELSCNFSLLYSNFTNLSPLPFLLGEEKAKDLSILSIFSKNHHLVLLIFMTDFFFSLFHLFLFWSLWVPSFYQL